MLELSRDHLPKDGYVLHVKTIVVSHGDKDHYNFIPKLFDDENPVIIETLILGGFAEDYDESFRNWVRHQADDQLSVHPLNIIYTGTSTGEESSALGIWPAAGYARAYCSKLVDKTQTEQRIEGALRFEQEGDSAPPTVEILSMNAGHAMEEVTQGTERRKIVRRANYDKNANSIVLRVKTQTQSMIFSGDADNSTWDHILTNYLFEQEALRTDYLLISHHGSREEGATRADILDVLQPKACVVSVGRHLGYHHPHQESLELLLKSDSSLYVIDDYHAVSYFGYVPSSNPKTFIHKVKKMKRAIFSTLNSGIISIPFGEGFGIRVSQAKETIYTDSANAESKFSIDYGSVMSPEEGESIVDLIQRFIRSKSERQKSVSIWEITDKRRNTISHPAASGGGGFNPDEETTHYDLLPDRENNRLYILETIE